MILLLSPTTTAFNPERGLFTLDLTLYSGDVDGDVHNVSISEGKETDFARFERNDPTHRIVMTAQNGTELFSQDVYVGFNTQPWGIEESTVTEQQFYWRLPYHRNAQIITIYGFPQRIGGQNGSDTGTGDVGQEIAVSIDLEDRFCHVERDGVCRQYCDGKQLDADCSCGDSTCQDYESVDTCPGDCMDDTDVANPSGTVEEDNGISRIVLGVIVLVLLLVGVAGIYLWARRGNGTEQSEARQGAGNQGYNQGGRYGTGQSSQRNRQNNRYGQDGASNRDDRYR